MGVWVGLGVRGEMVRVQGLSGVHIMGAKTQVGKLISLCNMQSSEAYTNK